MRVAYVRVYALYVRWYVPYVTKEPNVIVEQRTRAMRASRYCCAFPVLIGSVFQPFIECEIFLRNSFLIQYPYSVASE